MSMITPAPPTPQPTISPVEWAGDPEQCPPGVGYPSRQSLPAGLIWSGAGDVPAIGTRVHIYMNGFGPAEVRAYFHREGYLGVLCAPDQMPDWYRKQAPGVTLGHFFGKELEPRNTTPAAAEAPAAPPELSYAAQVIVSGQYVTAKAIEVQMKVKPRKAGQLFKEMQQRYGDKPTLLHLALFSGAADLLVMIKELREAGALTA